MALLLEAVGISPISDKDKLTNMMRSDFSGYSFLYAFEEIMKSVEIYNLLGQEVISKSINANETSIDVSQLPSGTYFVKVQIANTSKTIKVIKR